MPEASLVEPVDNATEAVPEPDSNINPEPETTELVKEKRSRKTLPEILSQHQKLKQQAAEFPIDSLRFNPTPEEPNEQELETLIVGKMREYRWKQVSEYGPYSEIDLQEILNPPDRLESILLHSSTRHGMNNLQLESLCHNLMVMIETEHQFVNLLQKLSFILQGDDPDWPSLEEMSEELGEEEWLALKENLMLFVQLEWLFIEKIQMIRDKMTFIYGRKKEFLKLLRERYGPVYDHFQIQNSAADYE